MDKNPNMDRRDTTNSDRLADASKIRPIINVKSLITIIKHPLITLKIIVVGLFTIILFLITLIAVMIEDKEFLKKLKGEKNGN